MVRRSAAVAAVLSFVLGSAVCAATIHSAAGSGNLAAVGKLIANNPQLISAQDATGATPLHWAVAGNKEAVVRFLLANGADVNARKKDGVTPLHVAASLGFEGVARQLVDAGADKQSLDSKGRTPLTLAQAKGRAAIVAMLSEPAAVSPPEEPLPQVGIGMLDVTVSDDRGRPIEGAVVTTSDGVTKASTDSEGKCSFKLGTGQYTVTATKRDYESATAEQIQIDADQTQYTRLRLRALSGTISGMVLDSSGAGVVGATVATKTGGYTATTDFRGQYSIQDVRPGRYDIEVRHKGNVVESREGVNVSVGRTANADFKLVAATNWLLIAGAVVAVVVLVAVVGTHREDGGVEAEARCGACVEPTRAG